MAVASANPIDWLWLYRLVGYIKAPPRPVVFSEEHPPPRKLLFIFPLSPDQFKQSCYLFDRLARYPRRRAIFFAIADIYQDRVPDPPHPTFFFPVSPDNPPRVKAGQLVEHFGRRRFGAVINLETQFDLRLARVVSNLHAPRRIGFAGPGADYLYNIQIETGQDQTPEQAYEQILSVCDLGAPKRPSRKAKPQIRKRRKQRRS
jgi:hypothetical protein